MSFVFSMHRQSISVYVAKKFVMFYLIHTESVNARVIHRKYYTAWTLISLKTAVSSIYDGAHTAYFSRQYIHVSVSKLCINIEKCTLFVLLFRMRTANDLRNHLLIFKNDIDEHYKLLVLEVRNGLVLYINIDLANLNKQETVRLVSKLVPNNDANLKALSQSITRLLASVKDMKNVLVELGIT